MELEMRICINHTKGLIVIPKAASNSVMNAIRMSGANWVEKTWYEFMELKERVAFMRNPADRIESAYRMYVRTGSGHNHVLDSFPAFVKDICADPKGDPHVMPQSEQLISSETFLPTRIIRWDFDELAEYIGHPIPHDNKGTDELLVWDREAWDVFNATYRYDIRMWSQQTL